MTEIVPVSLSPLFSLAGQLGPKVRHTVFKFNLIITSPPPCDVCVSVATVVLWCMCGRRRITLRS